MGRFDLTPEEGEVWREFRWSTKEVIAELLRARKEVAEIKKQRDDLIVEIENWEYQAGYRGR